MLGALCVWGMQPQDPITLSRALLGAQWGFPGLHQRACGTAPRPQGGTGVLLDAPLP